MSLLQGKVAIVTGGGSGIGKAMAERYAKEGASVVVSDISSEGGKATVEAITKAGGKAIFVKTDVSKASDCEDVVKAAVKHFGRLDIAFNNAGIAGVGAPIGEYPVAEWDKIIGIDLSGVFYGMHYQIPEMLKTGGGVIVNTSSIMGQVGSASISGYVAAKHGVVGLTKSAALDYAGQGIRVNAIGPGFINTSMTSYLKDNKDAYDQLVAKHPSGRMGEVEDVVELVLWLSCDKSSFCNGGYYPVDGGYLSQ